MPGSILYARTSEGLLFKQNAQTIGSESTSKNNDAIIQLGAQDPTISLVNHHVWLADVINRNVQVHKVAALLGFIRLKLNKYAILADTVEETGTLGNHSIYKVVNFSIISAHSSPRIDSDESEYLKLLEMQLNNATLHFSYTYDLTNSLQRNESIKQKPTWRTADTRFFWNHYITTELQELSQQDPSVDYFIQPIIYGYTKIVQTSLYSTPITVGIITRRSIFRAGTRYFRRGIDSEGNVGNFNETEQVLVVSSQDSSSSHVFAFLETRGSVPVKWAEINNLKYKPKLVLAANPNLTPTEIHFNQQKKLYGTNYLINLVNQKGHELPVKEAYESAVASLNDPEVRYVYFDFHHECRKMQWHKVKLLIPQLEDKGLTNDDYFYKIIRNSDGMTEKIVKEQHSILRTNCMDCLDRTNVVQSVFANWIMQNQLETAGVLTEDESWESDKSLLSYLQNLWADNADAVSLSYSGTGALKTDYTRTGKRTRAGAFKDFVNSASRYYQNNLTDGPRQDSYDLILGNFKPHMDSVQSPFTDRRPMYIQFIPTIIYAALTVLLATIFFPKSYFTSRKNLSFFFGSLFILAVGLQFVMKNGLQYVHWPKLVHVDFLTVEQSHNKEQQFRGTKYSQSAAFTKPDTLKKD
ncbi:hypothetical protein TBLA_0D03590 [Henningerozyma blattae CBS 6284]|uniref:SAC domain-containing protein n=1 Tax=Henningerozyma blattae (strain ATCC 34711 / CBS 6284 / DSM 70876 / NBRC 10599 / NRRL Y-10934 / UCD 77-7) TaxID=1071380 RepID=I2H3A7_HENB6|nr:hypothetical protein TBLA_0D03590 [Tetrapisispora blattae CBS 6284]CCH60859.1 hypothetical protein TBLA_0D03590 [Tetrapisispora blattae CBS 6284]